MSAQYFKTIHQIITTGHWVTHQVSLALKEFGITEPQYNVLRALQEAKGEPLTVEEILSKMVQRNSNVTRIVDKLLTKGYVERKECPSNRRKMDITITDLGIKDLRIFEQKVISFHQPMMDNLTEEELHQLNHLIKKLKSHHNE